MNKDYLNECLVYDETSGKFMWKLRPLNHFKNSHGMNIWNSQHAGKVAGTIYTPSKDSLYKRIKIVINNKPVMAHQAAWIMSNGEIPTGLYIDHIDGNSINNKLSNLRLVTHSENHRNRKIQSNNSSGTQGVSLLNGRWRARIKVNGKEKHLGYFNTKEEAINERLKHEQQYGFTERHNSSVKSKRSFA